MITASAVLMNWLVCFVFLFTAQTRGIGSHHMTTRLADWFLLISLAVIASLFVRAGPMAGDFR